MQLPSVVAIAAVGRGGEGQASSQAPIKKRAHHNLSLVHPTPAPFSVNLTIVIFAAVVGVVVVGAVVVVFA